MNHSSPFCSIKHHRIRLKNEQPLLCVVSTKGCANRSHLFPICHPFTQHGALTCWISLKQTLGIKLYTCKLRHLKCRAIPLMRNFAGPFFPLSQQKSCVSKRIPTACVQSHCPSQFLCPPQFLCSASQAPSQGISIPAGISDCLAATTKNVWEAVSRYLPFDS